MDPSNRPVDWETLVKEQENRLYRDGLQFYGGDGIVTKGVENTIANVGRLAREGMRSTDCEILDIMVGR